LKTAFYFCTRKDNPKDTLAHQSLEKILNKFPKNFSLYYNSNNTKGLSYNYNKILNEYGTDYDNIVFLHDDVHVDDFNVVDKLHDGHLRFDLVGLAGGINPAIKEPALWHIMCGGFGSGNLRGAVAHPYSKGQITMTSFGPTPSRVAILDGLFISVKTKSILNAGWQFNENYEFHHYDIASSIDANSKMLKLGVVPIWVAHNSPGLLNINDEKFVSSQEKFLNEYSSH
jgi:hypothetical protein